MTHFGQAWCRACSGYKYFNSRVLSLEPHRHISRGWFCSQCGTEEELAREKVSLFPNPVVLNFDPEHSAGDAEEGVTFAEVWADPIARTLWLGIAPCHLKSQYFRKACMDNAAEFRRQPPVTAEDFRRRLRSDVMWVGSGGYDADYCRFLYPFVVRAMFDAGEWPYIVPSSMAKEPLAWVVRMKEAA